MEKSQESKLYSWYEEKGGCELVSYWVKDTTPKHEKIRVVFVLESPHCSEVLHGHPLAGSSGRAVTKCILENEETSDLFTTLCPDMPFGCYLAQGNEDRVAVFNVSRMPMDPRVHCHQVRTKNNEILDAFLHLKHNPGVKSYTTKLRRELQERLIEDLRTRLEPLAEVFAKEDKVVRVFPCGEVARAFVKKANVSKDMEFYKHLPHPSRNQWNAESRLSDKKKKKFCENLRDAIVPPQLELE